MQKKENNYVIIGFIKCGQESIVAYLKDKTNGRVSKNEIIWREDGPAIWEKMYGSDQAKHGKAIPVIVTRDPVERCWSAYQYFQRKETYYDFLMTNDVEQFGPMNPILGSCYDCWISKWEKYQPMVIELEKAMQDPEFPHVNKTANKTPMPENFRKCTEELLDLHKEGYFWENNRPTNQAFKILNNYIEKDNP